MADDTLKTLFESYTGQQLTERTELPTSGSHRRYFRLKGGNISIVGVIGTSLEENRAFVAISKHFKEKGLNVPTVLAVSEDGMSYIQEDLGEKMLFDLIAQ
ncbi:MAG: phosphotransferase, partial [Bacteroidales bacterium]|nr:phosphotransferase [Bacteroidales bacterium]